MPRALARGDDAATKQRGRPVTMQSTAEHKTQQHAEQARWHNGLRQIDSLADAVVAHLDALGVQRSDWTRVGKVAEEGGEVIGALIKRTQNRATTDDVRDELGDVILAALAACKQLGLAPAEVIARRWASVSQRTASTLTKSAAAQADNRKITTAILDTRPNGPAS